MNKDEILVDFGTNAENNLKYDREKKVHIRYTAAIVPVTDTGVKRLVSITYASYDDMRAPLKTPSEKKQLCTASAASSPLVVRKHAFDGFSCIYCTYLLFLTQNGFLEVPMKNKSFADVSKKIQSDTDYQRTKDYTIITKRTLRTYVINPEIHPKMMIYLGKINIGDNNDYILNFAIETDGHNAFYMMQFTVLKDSYTAVL